jgi:hypothetical protein
VNIRDYFTSIERSVTQNRLGFLDQPAVIKVISDRFGVMRARIIFWDGSHLTIDETVDTSRGYPALIEYAYTYIRQNKHVFRYDNAPHYPHLETFPHHKHIGPDEMPEAAEPPTLNQIFREIEEILTANQEL